MLTMLHRVNVSRGEDLWVKMVHVLLNLLDNHDDSCFLCCKYIQYPIVLLLQMQWVEHECLKNCSLPQYIEDLT